MLKCNQDVRGKYVWGYVSDIESNVKHRNWPPVAALWLTA